MSTTVKTASFIEDGSHVALARILGANGVAIAQSDISSIDAVVYQLDDNGQTPTEILGTGDFSIVVGDVVYNTLQTGDPRWDDVVDTTGFNFEHTLPTTAIPEGGKRYRVEYRFTTASGESLFALFEGDSTKVYMS